MTLLEPSGYATDWGGNSAVRSDALTAHDGVREFVAGLWSGSAHGDPQATAAAVLTVVDAEEPSLRIFLGAGQVEQMREEYTRCIQLWEQWKDVSEAAMGTGA